MNPFTGGWTEEDVEAVLARGDPQELLYVPIVVGMNAPDCERAWAEAVCLQLAGHAHFNVRGNAILGLGHIARAWRALDLDKAVPVLAGALQDSSEYVRDHANNAASDLELYLKATVPGYDHEQTRRLREAVAKLRHENGI